MVVVRACANESLRWQNHSKTSRASCASTLGQAYLPRAVLCSFDTTIHPKIYTSSQKAGPRRKMKTQLVTVSTLTPRPLSSMLSCGLNSKTTEYTNIEERVQGWRKLGVAFSFSFAGRHFWFWGLYQLPRCCYPVWIAVCALCSNHLSLHLFSVYVLSLQLPNSYLCSYCAASVLTACQLECF